MTSIPVDRPADEPSSAVVELTPTRARAQARAHAPAHSGALAPAPTPAAPERYRSAVRELVQPPDVWSDERPSLRSLWLYAVYGPWTGERTPARAVGIGYAVLVAIPVHCLTYLANWIVERPARLIVAAVLTALIVLVF